MKTKLPTAYRCIENSGYFAENCKTKEEAFELICGEHPDSEDDDFPYTAKDLKEVFLQECLDCHSYWVGGEMCGECGEYRLSKRGYYAWYLEC